MVASPTPHGRDAVTDALIEAAIERFAAGGVRATSVRDIASRAGVNHGLVHHYFGSKRALLVAALDRLAARVAARADDLATPDAELLADIDAHWRIIAHALLEGEDATALQGSHPVIAGLVRREIAAGKDAAAARDAVAQSVAAGLGRLLFGRFIDAALASEAG